MNHPLGVSLEVVLRRLIGRNEALDRALRAALQPWRLGEGDLELIARRSEAIEPARCAVALAALPSAARSSIVTWEELRRPALDALRWRGANHYLRG